MAKKPSRLKRLEKAIWKVTEGKDGIQELRDEIESWRDNLEGTNLEGTQKFTALEECLEILEEMCDELDTVIGTDVDFPRAY